MMDDVPQADTPPDLRFRRCRRLRSSREYERVYALRQQAGDDTLLLFAALNELGLTRIGLSVSRKHGNSVARHRLRRQLREAYRLSQHQIPEGLDLILIPRPGADFSLPGLQKSLERLTARLAKRLEPARDQPTP